MSDDKIILKTNQRIAIITLNDPAKHNVLNPEMITRLSETYHACENNPDVDVIMLHAQGKHFCAGADLKYMLTMGNESFDNNLRDAKKFAQLFYQIYSCKKPTIACGHGNIRGGGIGLLAAHDIAIAEKGATFCFSEVRLGLVPAIISPYVLQRMYYQRAKYLMMSADVFDTQQALATQLIDHCCPVDSLLNFGFSIAQSLLENNVSAIVAAKNWLQTLQCISEKTVAQSATLLATMRAGADAKKLMSNFIKN